MPLEFQSSRHNPEGGQIIFKPEADTKLRKYFAMFERVHKLDPLAQVIRTAFNIARLMYTVHQRIITKVC
jgi:hypothetical protein